MSHTIVNPEGLHDPVPFGYSHTATIPAGAELVLVSGQYGSDANGAVVSPDFAEQVQQAFRNLGVALAAHDAELREQAAALARRYRAPYADAVRRGVESGAFTPRFEATAIVEVAVAQIVGLLYPVVLGHVAPQSTDYREVVLAQLAFALNHER